VADRQYSRLFADVLSFGWVLPATIAVGAGVGWLFDRLFGFYPVLTLVFGFLGFAAGVWQLWREAMVLSARGGDKKGDGPTPDGNGTP
jgi:F0F1-type ATP synthase assembly protein I